MVPTLAAHCVHVNEHDIELLAMNNIGVAIIREATEISQRVCSFNSLSTYRYR